MKYFMKEAAQPVASKMLRWEVYYGTEEACSPHGSVTWDPAYNLSQIMLYGLAGDDPGAMAELFQLINDFLALKGLDWSPKAEVPA